jgi:hypothetical protein
MRKNIQQFLTKEKCKNIKIIAVLIFLPLILSVIGMFDMFGIHINSNHNSEMIKIYKSTDYTKWFCTRDRDNMAICSNVDGYHLIMCPIVGTCNSMLIFLVVTIIGIICTILFFALIVVPKMMINRVHEKYTQLYKKPNEFIV